MSYNAASFIAWLRKRFAPRNSQVGQPLYEEIFHDWGLVDFSQSGSTIRMEVEWINSPEEIVSGKITVTGCTKIFRNEVPVNSVEMEGDGEVLRIEIIDERKLFCVFVWHKYNPQTYDAVVYEINYEDIEVTMVGEPDYDL